MRSAAGPRTPLFEGLDAESLAGITAQTRPRVFAAGETICVEGEAGHSLFVLQDGLAEVAISGGGVVARLRRGEVVGEMSLLSGEPRSATVTAIVPTSAHELDRETFTRILATYPTILTNLTAILSARLVRTTARNRRRERGEAIALVTAGAPGGLAASVIHAAATSCPRGVMHVAIGDVPQPDRPVSSPSLRASSVLDALGTLDDLLDRYGTTIVQTTPDVPELAGLLDQMDRAIVLAGPHELDRVLAAFPSFAQRFEVALVGEPSDSASVPALRIMRDAHDTAWLGRHLARTKIGLALGAGGAKGYAHIAALAALERAGYTVDYLAGSSIGAVIGAWHALGQNAAAVEATMRAVFTPENVAAMFKLGTSGMSSGLDVLARACHESTGGRSFEDLRVPLTMMAVDLNTRQPVEINRGTLWEGCLAAMAVAGVYPPFQHDNERLVDAVALLPVPASTLFSAGADIVVAVNLMSHEVLPAWPGEEPVVPDTGGSRVRMLDTLMEVMDLAQVDASIRHAARADVVITPRFGPASWRGFHLADRFLNAGAAAAATGIQELHLLARPGRSPSPAAPPTVPPSGRAG